jgi:hypothetical protein
VGLLDAILKQLVADDASPFAAWLLDAPADMVEPLTVELPADPRRHGLSGATARRNDGTTIVAGATTRDEVHV